MAKNIFTEENFQKLQKSIDSNRDRQGSLMPVLHDAQKIFGCVPLEVQKKVSEELNSSIV